MSLSAAIPLIIQWYRQNRRPLPWRQDASPYHVWISEIMLQQTRIEAVIPYYHRFIEAYPTVWELSRSDEDVLMKCWEGLGYYSRARNLQKCARILTEQYNGVLPSTPEELKKLPGIGDYTAGAIASIAYGRPAPAVDGNVMRLYARLLADEGDVTLPAVKKRITEDLASLYPSGEEAGLLTQGLMEMGERICIPASPRCDGCPLYDLCLGRRKGIAASLPNRSKKKPRRIEKRLTYLLMRDGKYAIRRRPAKGLLAGMWEFLSSPAEENTPRPDEAFYLGEAKHIFTHVEWHMSVYRVPLEDGTALPSDVVWATREEIEEIYALPTAMRCVLAVADEAESAKKR